MLGGPNFFGWPQFLSFAELLHSVGAARAVHWSGRFSMKYKIAVHESDEGYSVSVPGLPGCWSQGKTEAEALDNIKDAIREYLAVVDENLKGADIREVDVGV